MTRKIALLHSGKKDMFTDPVNKLKSALPADVVLAEDYYAEDDIGKLEDDADDLVAASDILLIVAAGGPQSAIAAKNATAVEPDVTKRKPVVFTTVFDPVQSELVDSLAVPVGNLTGMAGQTSELDPERLAILKEFLSQVKSSTNKIGVLMNPDRSHVEQQFKALAARARGLGLQLVPRRTNNAKGIKRAFNHFKKKNVLGAVVTADAFFNNNRDEVIDSAKQAGVPTIYQWREFAKAGGLISYGPSILEAYEQAGKYVKRILDNGESPGNMACSTPSSFELVVNKATATSLGLTVPSTIGGKPVIVI
jgi:putative tryptophan/tyrosine transport system substrate-binding protein